MMMRLDKYLADMGIGTRSEVKKYIQKGMVSVGNLVVKKPEYKVNTEKETIFFQSVHVGYETEEYYLLNKPAGVVSATEDKRDQTVIDLIKSKKRKDLFPVGRLDKDTEGLLLITNDGNLCHRLLSPKKHIDKVYYAKVAGKVTEDDVRRFKEGLDIGEKDRTRPGDLVILHSDDISEIELTIHEGKFHQVKRMFEAVDKTVLYLKRIRMGTLMLDENLETGSYRKLTQEEIRSLKEC